MGFTRLLGWTVNVCGCFLSSVYNQRAFLNRRLHSLTSWQLFLWSQNISRTPLVTLIFYCLSCLFLFQWILVLTYVEDKGSFLIYRETNRFNRTVWVKPNLSFRSPIPYFHLDFVSPSFWYDIFFNIMKPRLQVTPFLSLSPTIDPSLSPHLFLLLFHYRLFRNTIIPTLYWKFVSIHIISQLYETREHYMQRVEKEVSYKTLHPSDLN